ncbi:hypothetical protein BZG36_03908 [Bifiguratus adelaidae]|uniref:Dihydrofolate synthetase n=1 Tax=Bifiguratus adelaidae TaxID=1938954 RepID=A0A261XXN3_9FUNG|nr:hypothetical protein BZG36_03908 [Bifiguratus adelaidae]
MDLGLERVKALLRHLGNPQDAFAVIHVAGTNGKGSVCAYVASILRVSGYKTGRFNSPHLVHVRDSVQLNGQTISLETYEQAQTQVRQANERFDTQCTDFELLTATAMVIFREANVDIAVVEVGLGGRLDATNVFTAPLVCAITSIAMDHMNVLGPDIPSIAREKAGIFKSNAFAVIGPQEADRALEELVSRARSTKGYVICRPGEWLAERPGWASITVQGGYLTTASTVSVPIPLNGEYQLSNAATGINIIYALIQQHLLLARGLPLLITEDMIRQGMAETRWPGRLSWESTSALKLSFSHILVDGAHNVQAAAALREFVDTLLGGTRHLEGVKPTRVCWIFGMTQGKDVEESLRLLLRPEDDITFVPFSQPEGMPWIHAVAPESLSNAAQGLGVHAYTASTLLEGLQTISSRIPSMENDQPLVCLAGSLYLVADFYRLSL